MTGLSSRLLFYPFPFPISGKQVSRMMIATLAIWTIGSFFDTVSTMSLMGCVGIFETNPQAAHFLALGPIQYIGYSLVLWIIVAVPQVVIVLRKNAILSAKPFGIIQSLTCWSFALFGLLGLLRVYAAVGNFSLFLVPGCVR